MAPLGGAKAFLATGAFFVAATTLSGAVDLAAAAFFAVPEFPRGFACLTGTACLAGPARLAGAACFAGAACLARSCFLGTTERLAVSVFLAGMGALCSGGFLAGARELGTVSFIAATFFGGLFVAAAVLGAPVLAGAAALAGAAFLARLAPSPRGTACLAVPAAFAGRLPAPARAGVALTAGTSPATSPRWISASTVSGVGAPAGCAKPGSASSTPRLMASKAWTTKVRFSPLRSTSRAERGGSSPMPANGK